MTPQREMCLVLVTREVGDRPEVLLGVKRRGFGEGRVVAPGGKIDAGETPPVAAARELFEETGLRVTRLDVGGTLSFTFPHDPATPDLRAHVFTASAEGGEPQDSDEILVRWTPIDAIPYDRMWADSRHWVPLALTGVLGDASFVYAPDGVSLESFTL